MSKKNKGSSSGGRIKASVRVKTAKGRKPSSTKWLERQLNDPFVKLAKKDGYRSRAAYKFKEIDEKFKLLKPGIKVVDLGAAPGSWSQVVVEKKGDIVGVDLLPVEPIEGAVFIEGDFLDNDILEQILEKLDGKVDLVISDMAAASSGHSQTDHIRIIHLCDVAVDFAIDVLDRGGAFVAKVLQGGTENQLLHKIKQNFKSVKHFKPKASRQDSAEMYVVALHFKG